MLVAPKLKTHSITKSSITLLFIFLLFFPKGGIKIGPVPITWGYLLLLFFALTSLFQHSYSINKDRCKATLLMLPFQALSFCSFIFLSIERVSMTLSFILSLFFFPYFFFLLFSSSIDMIEENYLSKMLTRGILFVSCFGIFLFFSKMILGYFLQIPLLTVNLDDFQKLDDKCIDRGFGFKLISTYNNGNLYGICLLMLLPLYSIFENSKLRKGVVKFSLLLTISRTVWVGLFAYEFFYDLIVSKKKKLFFLKAISSLCIILSALYAFSVYYELPLSFFFDHTLGGRRRYILQAFFDPSLLPNISFKEIREAVYPSIFEQFGLIGFLLFILQLTSPVIIKGMQKQRFTKMERALFLGIFLYWVLCISDGAMLLIPTMAFYWFLSSLLLKNFSSSVEPFQTSDI